MGTFSPCGGLFCSFFYCVGGGGGLFYVLMVVFFGLAHPPPPPPHKHLYGRQCPGCPNEEKNVAKGPHIQKSNKNTQHIAEFFSRGAHNLAPPPRERVLYMPPPLLRVPMVPLRAPMDPPPLEIIFLYRDFFAIFPILGAFFST